jgi:hypothetical protein
MRRSGSGSTALGRAALAALGALLAFPCWSGEAAAAGELKWTHFGVRPLGMGNAFVAVADDFNALFYNPAGLARLKTWDGELLNPTFEISDNTRGALQDVQGLGSSDFDETLAFLEDNTGKTHHGALGLTPHLIMPGFGFAIGTEVSTTLAVHREISADVDLGPRIIAPVAVAFNMFEDRLSVGAGLKLVARAGVDREFSINDIEALSSSKKKKEEAEASGETVDEESTTELADYVEGGVGVGTDFGILFTPIRTFAPTLGLSVTDFGGTPYKKFDVQGEALGTPDLRLPSVNVGLSAKPLEVGGMYVLTAVDAHAINQPEHYSKKFNLGVEWGYGSIIKLQSGLHQGELSAGFEFDVFLLSIRFATYAEQLGTVAGQDDDLRDRRYVFQVKLLI